jgi:hypothetical protein
MVLPLKNYRTLVKPRRGKWHTRMAKNSCRCRQPLHALRRGLAEARTQFGETSNWTRPGSQLRSCTPRAKYAINAAEDNLETGDILPSKCYIKWSPSAAAIIPTHLQEHEHFLKCSASPSLPNCVMDCSACFIVSWNAMPIANFHK